MSPKTARVIDDLCKDYGTIKAVGLSTRPQYEIYQIMVYLLNHLLFAILDVNARLQIALAYLAAREVVDA